MAQDEGQIMNNKVQNMILFGEREFPLTEKYMPSVVELFSQDSGTGVEYYFDGGRLFLGSSDGSNELMLRLFKNAFIIARVGFNNIREGNGSKLLAILKDWAKELELESVEVESSMTEGMNNFCIKNKFSLCKQRSVGSIKYWILDI